MNNGFSFMFSLKLPTYTFCTFQTINFTGTLAFSAFPIITVGAYISSTIRTICYTIPSTSCTNSTTIAQMTRNVSVTAAI